MTIVFQSARCLANETYVQEVTSTSRPLATIRFTSIANQGAR